MYIHARVYRSNNRGSFSFRVWAKVRSSLLKFIWWIIPKFFPSRIRTDPCNFNLSSKIPPSGLCLCEVTFLILSWPWDQPVHENETVRNTSLWPIKTSHDIDGNWDNSKRKPFLPDSGILLHWWTETSDIRRIESCLGIACA